MTPEEFILLQESIASFGVEKPILMWEGMVLDGWHRYSIAQPLGIKCKEEEFTGTLDEAKARVLREHNRRNWTPSQRALNIAEIHAYQRAAAPGAGPEDSNADLADKAEVSERTMRQARAVVRNAIPEVKGAVRSGDLSLKKAEQIATKPKSQQKKALTSPPASPPAWRSVGPLPRPEIGASKAALEELKERNSILSEEHDALTARLAVHFMEGTDEEKMAASVLIAELQAQVKSLEVKCTALIDSRDTAVQENNELKRQCALYRNQLAKHNTKK